MKIGIGFVTGRKGFKHLINTYVNNWNEHGFVEDPDMSLKPFVAYDLTYFGTSASDYKRIDPGIASKLNGLEYFGKTRIAEERQRLVREGVLTKDEAEMLFGEGYGRKRNAVVWFAIRDCMDRLLFIDDDEYPLAVLRGQHVFWQGQSVLGTHLAASETADITHGRHCGYISPIPRIRFDEVLTEARFKEFIEALSNDIVRWDKIKEVVLKDGGVTYADPEVLGKSLPEDVPCVKGMKFISGANLCLNLRRGGADAPFFNPPGARGEDTFLSTCLADKRVVRVPVYTFHDGFLRYQSLLNGVLPRSLEPADARDPEIVRRFAKATIGWVRYKPLLTYITDRGAYPGIIESMKGTMATLGPLFDRWFRTNEFARLSNELKRYVRQVPEHYELFERTKEAWRKALPWAREHPLGDDEAERGST